MSIKKSICNENPSDWSTQLYNDTDMPVNIISGCGLKFKNLFCSWILWDSAMFYTILLPLPVIMW